MTNYIKGQPFFLPLPVLSTSKCLVHEGHNGGCALNSHSRQGEEGRDHPAMRDRGPHRLLAGQIHQHMLL